MKHLNFLRNMLAALMLLSSKQPRRASRSPNNRAAHTSQKSPGGAHRYPGLFS